jgi:hypothetical protein
MVGVRHVPGDVIEDFDDDYDTSYLMVFFERRQTDGIKLAAAAAHMSVTAFIHRAVADAVSASALPTAPAIGTISPAAANPARKSAE